MEPADWPRTQKTWKIDQELIFFGIYFDNFVSKFLVCFHRFSLLWHMGKFPICYNSEIRNEIIEKNTKQITSWSIFHVFWVLGQSAGSILMSY